MKLIRNLLFLFTLVLSASLHADTYSDRYVGQIEVIFQNLSSPLSEETVLQKMQTREGLLFSQDQFDRDLKALAEDYDLIEPIIESRGDFLYITLKIWIKPRICSIVFCGNEKMKTKRLQKKLDIAVGSIYDRAAFIEALNELKIFYLKKGYFDAQLCFEIMPVGCGDEIEIKIIIDEGRAGKIKTIKFCGLDKREERDLLEMIYTKKYNFLFSWYTGGGCYHREMIEHDRLCIVNYMQNLGYADAEVDIQICEYENRREIGVIITIDRGICYNFGRITFSGNTVFTNEEILDVFQVWSQSHYSPDDLRTTALAIEELYGSCGYIDAYVDVRLSLHESEPVYEAHLTIEEGDLYTVGLIRLLGNWCTQSRVILHESLLCPGDVFNIKKVEGTETRLVNTGLFNSVNVYPVRPGDDDDCRRDVFIEVEETDTAYLGLFFGFSSVDRLFAGVQFTERNFNHAGLFSIFQRGPAALRGGGEYLHLKANIGDRTTTYLLQWTKPYFLDTPWIVGFDLEKSDNRAISRGYEIKTYGGNVHASYIYNEYLKYSWHYRAIKTHNSVRSNTSTLLEQEARISGFISALGISFCYDSTDHPRCPTCGLRSRLSGELAGLGGNFQFMKFEYFNSYYYPLTAKGVFKFRLDLQFIHTYGRTQPETLPLGERFYLGGECTVRGYRPYIIGPKFGANEPRGGVSALLISEEFQHPLFPGVDWFVFMDAGSVSLSEFNITKLRSSVGFGLRVCLIPSMPFSIGMGYPIHPSPAETQRFFFSMGGCF